jgi:hypothetical protein
VRLLALATAAVFSAAPSLGITVSWIGPAGASWNNSANWSSTHVPAGGDTAIFTPSPAGSYVFDEHYTSGTAFSLLTFGKTGATSSAPTLTQSGSTTIMDTTSQEVFENGTYSQSAGENESSQIFVGKNANDTADYDLSGGSINAGQIIFGNSSSQGTLNMSGGLAISVNPWLIGVGTGSGGTVNLSGGNLDGNITIGTFGGNGTLIQNATSTITVGGTSPPGAITIGASTGATGYANLSAGTLDALSTSTVTVGGNGGTGTLLQSGTSVISLTSGYLSVGEGTGSVGTANLSGGSSAFDNAVIEVGTLGGSGTLMQSGTDIMTLGNGVLAVGDGTGSTGVLSLAGGTISSGSFVSLTVGNYGGSGTLIQSGSSYVNLPFSDLYIGNGSGATGVASLSGGLLDVKGLAVGDGYGSMAVGTLLQSGTSIIDVLQDGGFIGITGSGTAILSGGTITSPGGVLNVGYGSNANGYLKQSGTSYINLGSGTLNVAGGSTFSSSCAGTLDLSAGTIYLRGGRLYVGRDGAGTLLQSGTSYVDATDGDVFVGVGSASGVLNLSGGTLNANLIEMAAGGTASLMQSGTSVINVTDVSNATGLEIGGVATLSGGTINITSSDLSVGYYQQSGTLIQNGANVIFLTLASPLYIGAASQSTGLASLSNGVLDVASGGSIQIGHAGGAGTLLLGGTSLVQFNNNVVYLGSGSTSGGTVSLSGDGGVNLTGGNFIVGYNGGTGVLIQSGTSYAALGTASLVIGQGSDGLGDDGIGVATLSGGTFIAGPLFIGLAGGIGTLNQSGTEQSTFGPAIISSTGTLAISGGTMGVQKILSAGSVKISGGTLAITGAGSLGAGTTSSTGLSISGSGVLDVGSGAIVIEYGGGASPVGDLSFGHTARNYPANSIQRYAQTGFDALSWNGPGINSSYAENDPNELTAVGVADENDLENVYPADFTKADGGSGTWMGQAINDPNNVLVRMTYYGDGNLDGVVNKFDVAALAQGYSGLAGYIGWSDGDYTYAGYISKLDISLLAESYVFQGAPLGDAETGDAITAGQAQYLIALDPDMPMDVHTEFNTIAAGQTPEPASLAVLCAAGVGLLGRRQRSSRI